MAIPGKVDIHQALPMYWRPSDSIRPQVTVGGWTPRPRKLSAASASMVVATTMLASTMIEPVTLGRMCLNMIFRPDCPSALAAMM